MTDELTNPSGDLDPDAQAEVEVLETEIEATREEMTDTVQTIGDRLDPANVVQGAKDTVREATVGKVEHMTSNVMETAADTGSGIVETIRRNPIPAAMAAIGIGWLFMKRSDSGSSYRTSGAWNDSWNDRDRYGYGYERRGTYGQPQGQGLTDRAGEKLDDVGRKAGEVADDVRSTVGSTFERVPDQIGSRAQDVTWNAQQMMQDNPLALGAVAVAVGAAIGMALPETQVERQVLGEPAGKAIDKVQRAASDAVQQLETSNT